MTIASFASSILARDFCGELGTDDPSEESAEKLLFPFIKEVTTKFVVT